MLWKLRVTFLRYGKCGRIKGAQAVFHSIPATMKKDVRIWTNIINLCAINGLAKAALDAFSQMLQENVRPNDITFTALLNACRLVINTSHH